MPWPWGEQANRCWLHLSTVPVRLTAGKRRIEYGVLMWISAVYQWLCYLKREGLMGSSKWKMTSHCWLWLFRAHSLPLETNMKQNAVMLAPRAEGIKRPADMVQSHQNALLSCVLQGEPGEPRAGEMLTLSLCCHHWPYGNNKHETSPIYFFLVEGLIRLNYKSRCLHV